MTPFYQEDGITILQGDCREILPTLPDQSINCCVTSPPYWGLRDYGTASWEGGDAGCDHRKPPDKVAAAKGSTLEGGKKTAGHQQESWGDYCRKCGARRIDQQRGLEATPEEYVSRMVEVFREVHRVLRDDGTLWLNLGDCYAHSTSGGGGAVDIRTDGRNTKPSDKVRGRMKGADTLVEGLKPKDLVGQPWRVAFALQADGWYLRSDIIWHKPNPMPESVTDRPTKAHEYLFLLSKSERYYYDAEAIKEPFQTDPKENYPARARITGRGNQEAAAIRGNDRGKSGGFPPKQDAVGKRGYVGFNARWDAREGEVLNGAAGRNKRSVWTVPTDPYPEAHFATFPTALIEPCIKAGCPAGGTVFDPFGGSGTTMQVARALVCRGLMIELNPDYCRLAAKRLRQGVLPLMAAQ